MGATATQLLRSLDKGKTSEIFLSDEGDAPELTPQMREDIDRRLAIAQEQIRNGQYRPLDDEFMKEFSDKAYARSRKLLDSKR